MTVVAVLIITWFLAVCALGAWWIATLIVDEVAAALRRRRAWRSIRSRVANDRQTIAVARVLRHARRARS
jgi:hypothetical protein